MNIFFDVDYTIISETGDLRPHVREVFQQLVEDGHDIYIWSGVGLRHEVVRHHRLEPYVRGIYLKPLERHHEMLPQLGVDVTPDFVVDDHYAVVRAFGGVLVNPYYGFFRGYGAKTDAEMLRVYQVIQSLNGHAPGDR